MSRKDVCANGRNNKEKIVQNAVFLKKRVFITRENCLKFIWICYFQNDYGITENAESPIPYNS